MLDKIINDRIVHNFLPLGRHPINQTNNNLTFSITGYGPLGNVVTFTTRSAGVATLNSMGRGGTKLTSTSTSDVIDNNNAGNSDNVNPIVLYAIFGVGAGIILVLVIGVVVVLRYKCQAAPANDPRYVFKYLVENIYFFKIFYPSNFFFVLFYE